jgi:hypothetical protein
MAFTSPIGRAQREPVILGQSTLFYEQAERLHLVSESRCGVQGRVRNWYRVYKRSVGAVLRRPTILATCSSLQAEARRVRRPRAFSSAAIPRSVQRLARRSRMAASTACSCGSGSRCLPFVPSRNPYAMLPTRSPKRRDRPACRHLLLRIQLLAYGYTAWLYAPDSCKPTSGPKRDSSLVVILILRCWPEAA